MCFKKKNVLGQTYIDDRKQLLLAAQEIDVLILLDKDKKFERQLNELKDELLYVSPRENKEVCELDRKIKDKIGDLKLILNKYDDLDEENVDKIISTIMVIIKERDAKVLK